MYMCARASVAAPAASSARTASAYSSPQQPQPSTRMIAATALALFLRYTTYIEPPPARARDDHLLPCLVRVLSAADERLALRSDPKLRHRLLAALGESVFYISAQLEEAPGEDGGRWIVPPAAVSVLVACLKDDTDEVVRHYAAKVSEPPPFYLCACLSAYVCCCLCVSLLWCFGV